MQTGWQVQTMLKENRFIQYSKRAYSKSMQSLENSRSRWKRFAINENNMAKDKKTNLSHKV